MFGLTACLNLPYMLLNGIPSIQETGGHFKITDTNCILSVCKLFLTYKSSLAGADFLCYGCYVPL